MIDDDLQNLALRDAHSLSSLQADIWKREGDMLASKESAQRMAGWQAGILAVAVVSAASLGVLEASSVNASGTSLTHSDLAPASLLIGDGE